MSAKELWIYDEEMYINFFSVKFKSYSTDERLTFIVFHDPENESNNINQLPELLEFIFKRVSRLVGFNNKDFDDRVLTYLILHRERLLRATVHRITHEVKSLANDIIESQHKNNQHLPHIKELKQKLRPLSNNKFFKSLDLLLQFNTIDRTNLKQIGINMRWPKLQDLPLPVDSVIKHSDIDVILSYQDNDVEITEALMIKKKAEIKLRQDIGKSFGVDVLNSNDTDIAKAILFKFYSEETGIKWSELKNKRTFYQYLDLKRCISPRIRLKTREYQKLREAFEKARIDPNKKEDEKSKSQFEYTIRSKYLEHSVKLGGIHSVNPSEIIMEDEDFLLLDIDVGGFYPWIFINDRLFPSHLGPTFLRVYEHKVVRPRMKLKKEGFVVEAETLKKSANSAYGLLKSIHSWLYDPRISTTICISGQLYLIMLMEAIEMHSNAIAVYSNTDGLTLKIPRNEYQKVLKICKNWENYTGFELEYVQYKKMVIRDINNYVMFTYDKKKPIKAKGAFLVDKTLASGYNYPIVAKALVDYYSKGTPIAETVNKCNDVYMFLKAQKVNEYKFDVMLKNRTTGEATKMQKTNRWLVTDGYPGEGKLYTLHKHKNEEKELQKKQFVTVVNDIPEWAQPDSYKVNYSFYINQALRVMNKIHLLNKPTHNQKKYTQTKMFDAVA